jgi:hypothetical protein
MEERAEAFSVFAGGKRSSSDPSSNNRACCPEQQVSGLDSFVILVRR